MNQEERDEIAHRTQDWVQRVVVGLGLCPFARDPFESGRVRIAVSEADAPEHLVPDLIAELDRLVRADPRALETTLIAHPRTLQRWDRFNAFLNVVDTVVEELQLEGTVQVASFHPQYQFEGTPPDAPENHTNRAPYPTLHLLREDSVTRAVEGHPDVASIPRRNVELLRSMSKDELEQL